MNTLVLHLRLVPSPRGDDLDNEVESSIDLFKTNPCKSNLKLCN